VVKLVYRKFAVFQGMTAVCCLNPAVAIHFVEPINQINLCKINQEQLNLFSQINLENIVPLPLRVIDISYYGL
jgi:hypothetical protein